MLKAVVKLFFWCFPVLQNMLLLSSMSVIAGGAHRHIEMNPETQQQLSNKDAGAADGDTCQACVDKDCALAKVRLLTHWSGYVLSPSGV